MRLGPPTPTEGAATPPRRLVQSMVAPWSEDVKREGTSRVTWEIQPIAADSCRLTVAHDQLRDGANEELRNQVRRQPRRKWPPPRTSAKTVTA